jgi:ubiquinone/menaquinone biosynthesis C-methylase UbiE
MATKRRDCEERFRERYSVPTVDAMLAVEREAIGANVGANGYTTLAQADTLAERLQLTPEATLLDLGSGRGWPGLHLAARIGCRTVLVDLPEPALAAAARRAQKQGLSDRVSVLRADAAHLPFLSDTFDAITHTDTL